MHLKQSTAVVISFGPFVDKTDGVTPETGLVSALDHGTTGILLSKNGGALTIRHATVTATTYDSYGNYLVTLDTTDTNTLGRLRMQFIETATCLPVWIDFMVLPANVWDSLYGADLLQVDATQILGTAVATPATAGVLDVNVKNINNVAAATPGASGGILISGSNSGTTTLGALTVSGATTLAALSCTTLTASGAVAFQSTFAVTTSTSLGALSCTTLTASGAVAFQSTFAVTTSTSLAALSCATLTASGAVAFQSTFAVTTSTSLAALSATTITASGTTSLAAVTTSGTVTFNAFTVTNALTAGTNAVPWNASWDIEVQSEVQDAIEVNHLDHLLAVAAAGTEAVNSSYWSRLVSKSATPAFSSFDNTTDSLEALRDRGDAAWITATGFSTLDAAGVRAAVGLASANLDTQLTAIDDYLDTEIAAIKAVTDLFTAAQSEPSAAPAANATPLAKLAWLAALARNKITQTSTTQIVYADDGTTTVATSTHSDDGTTHTRGEWS